MKFIKFVGLFAFICFFSISVSAQDTASTEAQYQLLSGVPGLSAVNTSSGDFSEFVNAIYRMSIGVGAALAVIMIIFSGIQYSMSAVAGKKSELKDRITMSLGGLGLLLGAFVFLEFINPDLTDLDNKGGNLSSIEFSELNFEPVSVVEISDLPPVDVSVETEVWVASDGTGGSFDTEQECISASDPREITPCRFVPNPDLETISTPPGGEVDGILILPPNSTAMNITLNALAIERNPDLQNWAPNPYRSPADFIDCKGQNFNTGTKSVKVSRYALEADAYINYNLQQLGLPYPIPINSGFRSNPTCRTSGTRSNHPFGASFDYNISSYSSAQRKTLQEIALRSGAKRLGFGGNFFHVQWDGGSSGSTNIYWCYSSNRAGPYDSQSMPSNWTRGGSCSG